MALVLIRGENNSKILNAIADVERHANLKYKYGNRHFWCTGLYVSTVGNNKTAVYRYVENQLKEDMMTDQLTIKEYKDPFKGGK